MKQEEAFGRENYLRFIMDKEFESMESENKHTELKGLVYKLEEDITMEFDIFATITFKQAEPQVLLDRKMRHSCIMHRYVMK